MQSSPFLTYYEHLAKLSQVANKQTLFFAHLLLKMEYHEESKQNIVSLTPRDKKQILKAIQKPSKDGSIPKESVNPLRLASQYLSRLQGVGLIKYIGDCSYAIDPRSYGYSKYVPKHLRERSGKLYESRIFIENGECGCESYLISDDGERIDLI